MDTIIKRENCLEDSKLAKQVMMCSCVCWPHGTKSSDGRLPATMKMKNKKCPFYESAQQAASARRSPEKQVHFLLLEVPSLSSSLMVPRQKNRLLLVLVFLKCNKLLKKKNQGIREVLLNHTLHVWMISFLCFLHKF